MTRALVRPKGLIAAGVCVVLAACAAPPAKQAGAPTPVLAVQRAVEGQIGMPVNLRIDTSNAYRDWVFLAGAPLTAQGQRIDYSRTRFAKDMAEGYFDDNFVALVKRSAPPANGWRVVELSLGATDAPFVGWFEKRGLPIGLASSDSVKP